MQKLPQSISARRLFSVALASALLAVASCDTDTVVKPSTPEPGVEVVYIPVVIHVLNYGEPVGVGPNLSTERIVRQIQIMNEDFRRKKNTRGFNDHPDGADALIEFVLAKQTPEGDRSNGINRIDISDEEVPNLGYNANHFSQYAYWDPKHYINIWTMPLPEDLACLVLGSATGPVTDLPGGDEFQVPGEGDAEGILMNWSHFGESNIDCHARYGRTLTHEMGHYFGLLHTWGRRDCVNNDYCEDTPAVNDFVWGSTSYMGCAGEMIMIGNYMNYSEDAVMNIFTIDQVERMHYVLKKTPTRNSLLSSPGLLEP